MADWRKNNFLSALTYFIIMRSLNFVFILFVFAIIMPSCNEDPYTYALIETDFGTMKAKLYNSTPNHRDNFIKLAEEGYYDDLLFHRILPNFMIQGGDPDSRNAAPGQMLGLGGPDYLIDPEIGAPHKRGALAAAQKPNLEKKSSGSQFYIVQGQKWDDASLNRIEQQYNITFSEEDRQMYKEIGGAPFLDGSYTVFGEVVEGLEVIDKIATQRRGNNDRPVEDIKMKITIQ